MKAHVFQIFHDELTRSQIDAGFEPLDNSANPDPQWREYGAIRHFFLSQSLDENELYGFLASDFGARTALSAESVHAVIRDNPGGEVYVFEPLDPGAACYLNVFEQGNRRYPGLLEAAEAFVREVPLDVDLRTLVMSSRASVSGYYIVAKPSFWQTWFALTEKLFALYERTDADVRQRLDALTAFGPELDSTGLLIGRIAALVLTLCPDIEVRRFDEASPSAPAANPAYQTYARQIAFLNQLKADFDKSEDPDYLNNFYALRGAVLQACEGKRLDRAKEGFLKTQLPHSADLLYVCFTHVPPPFQFPSYVSMLCLGKAQAPGNANLRDLAPEWEPYHPQIGALAGCFALKNYILQHGIKVRHVGMCQYRKFVSNETISGVPAANYPIMETVNPESLDDASMHRWMLPGERDFLLVTPGVVQGSYLEQYVGVHVAEDFLRFTAEAVELGVLPRNEIMPFYLNNGFMPGGIEIGVFPMDFWIETISKIEKVVWNCVKRFPGQRTGYQARSWAFCTERLGSYLLLRHLQNRYGPGGWQHLVGKLNLLTEPGSAMYTMGR